jgi:PAS domain S-box-containing protein
MSNETKKSAKQAEAEAEVDSFRQELGPFVVAAQATRMPMLFTNAKAPDNPIIFANDAFLSLTGYKRDEVLAKDFNSLMATGIDREKMTEIEASFANSPETDPEIHYRRKDGSEFWASVLVSPVCDEKGEIVQHFVSFVDLTKHKHDQAHCKMLIDELNHRVKNTLSTVQSIVIQALRTPASPEVVRESVETRLLALSRSHDLLSSEHWEGAGLHDLVDNALEPFRVVEGRAERFVVTGENVLLPPKTTLALAIALHELATNAVKYGAFSNEAGTILIGWKVERGPEGKRLNLRWEEHDGPPVVPPTRKGFGSWVIERGLAHELEGDVELSYSADGVVCAINVPLAGVTHDG